MRRSISNYDLIRYVVAFVFIVSGLMKLTQPHMLTTFSEIGIPFPYYMMYVLALLEVILGLLISINKWVLNATLPLIIIMITALAFTKLPVISNGIIPFLFQSRLDLTILILLFVLYRSSNKISF
ncbi:DoxX family protein [Sutcliffiella cohnii]